MEEEPEEPEEPTGARKPSLAFSWATLGFIVGTLFVLALPARRPPPLAPEPITEVVKRTIAPELTTIEAVFLAWDKYAVWSDDTTQVALYNDQTKDFSDFYEVLRVNENYYFRTITGLTRPVLTHGGIPANSPLLFTETAQQQKEWLRANDEETLKALRDAFAPHRP
jgi:hypothetical protein